MVVLPTTIREPSRSVARVVCCPSTTMPLVDPRSWIVEGVPARISQCRRETPGSSIRTSASVLRPRTRVAAGDLMAGAVDLDPAARPGRWASAPGPGRGPCRTAAPGPAGTAARPAMGGAPPGGGRPASGRRAGRVSVAAGATAAGGGGAAEAPAGPGSDACDGLDASVRLRTRYRPVSRSSAFSRWTLIGPHEGVALLLGVVADHAGQLVAELAGVGAEPLVVRRAQLDDEVIGYDGPVAVPDRRVVVALALEGAGDLDGLDLGLEHLREGAVDQTFETLLETSS